MKGFIVLVVYVKIDFCNMSHSELVVIIALMYLQGNAFFFLEFYGGALWWCVLI